MTKAEDIRGLLARLFAEQRVAVLATENKGQPHTSLMAFAVYDDLKSFVLATRCNTKKHENLQGNTRVSLLVDNRTEGFLDPQDALAVTVMGNAELTSRDEKVNARDLFLHFHPESISLTEDSNSAIWRIQVVSYQVVKGFDTFEVWRLDEDQPKPSNG